MLPVLAQIELVPIAAPVNFELQARPTGVGGIRHWFIFHYLEPAEPETTACHIPQQAP